LAARRSLPVLLNEQTFSGSVGMSQKCQNRTRAANAIRFHFGDEATTNSAVSKTFDFMEFEMKHCASTVSMISRARSSSALSLRLTRGLPTTMFGFPDAESVPRRAELQAVLAL
jgi:hypothetical protein